MAYVKIRPRRSTAAEWEYDNPILAEGEMGIENPVTGTGTGFVKVKFGDGVSPWADLPYGLIGGAAGGGDLKAVETRVVAVENFLENLKPRLVLIGIDEAQIRTLSVDPEIASGSSDAERLEARIKAIEDELEALNQILLLIDDSE